jgi:hypothetical protein
MPAGPAVTNSSGPITLKAIALVIAAKDLTMSTAQIIKQLEQLSNPERLAVIEAATQLVRADLLAESSAVCQEQNQRLQAAAMALKDLYEPGGELTEWTSLDAEEIIDGSVPG